MKIEKISNDKIKCIIGRDELLNRHIEVSKLKYGTLEAKELFKDIMDKAFDEFGFEIKGVPTMIEAIPLSTGEIMLIVTKVKGNENETLEQKERGLDKHTFEKEENKTVSDVNIDKDFVKDGKYSICLDKFDDLVLLAKNIDTSVLNNDALFFDEKSKHYYLYLDFKKDPESKLEEMIAKITEFSYEPIKNYEISYLNEKYKLVEKAGIVKKCKKF